MELSDLFPDQLPIDRQAAEGARLPFEKVPAKGAVYLLADAEEGEGEKPMLLATVGDLRAALQRRLMDVPADVKTKRVQYGQVCGRVYWRRVDSSFAANWWYWKSARALFPESYAAMVPWRTSWWIGVDREGAFPRMRRTSDLRDPDLDYAGPIRDKHAAERLIETVVDAFDLCRYYPVLLQAPAGKACAYKEMGKCPAPCDGSIEVAWYAGQMRRAWGFLTGDTRTAWKEQLEAEMRAAAGRLEFEAASRIKKRLARAGALEGRAGEATALVRGLESFSFVALQPGKGKPWAEPWIVHGGNVECMPQIEKKRFAEGVAAVLARYNEIAQQTVRATIDSAGIVAIEQMGIATHHLFRGADDHGIWVGGDDVRNGGIDALTNAADRLWAKKAPKPMPEVSSEKGEERTAPTITEPVSVELPLLAESEITPKHELPGNDESIK